VNSGADIAYLVMTRNLILQDLKGGQVSCHQRRVSGYLRDGYYHRGSSEQLFNVSDPFNEIHPDFTATNHHSIAMIGLYVAQNLARKSAMS